VAAEAKAGASLWGALELLSDHAVPPPERVCLAGEAEFPEEEKCVNWTVRQHAMVISGPGKRALYRSIGDVKKAKPVFKRTPWLMLGPGVRMRKAWQVDVKAGRCKLAPAVEKL